MLLVAAGLFVSTFRTLATLPLGFDADRILVVDVDTARAHADPASRLAYYQQLVDAVRGSARRGAARPRRSITPFNPATKSPLFADPSRVHEQVVSPEFFATYGQAMRAGRDFDSRDSAQAPRVVDRQRVVRPPVPRGPGSARGDARLGPLRSPPRDVCDRRRRDATPSLGPLRSGLRPTIYFPLAQSATLGPPGRTTIALSLRSASGSPALLAPGVGRRAEPVRPPAVVLLPAARAGRHRRAHAGTAAGDAVVVLRRAGAAAVGPRPLRHDRACRRAPPHRDRHPSRARSHTERVVRLVLLRTLTVTGLGMLAGIAASVWASRFIASLLFGVQPGSPGTIAAAGLILMMVAAVASAIPAFRASRSDPARALREA